VQHGHAAEINIALPASSSLRLVVTMGSAGQGEVQRTLHDSHHGDGTSASFGREIRAAV